jgi:hypothetical protein
LSSSKNRGGFIGGDAQGCAALLALVNMGARGMKKKSNSEISHNFQGFSFFEVKIKLISQCP